MTNQSAAFAAAMSLALFLAYGLVFASATPATAAWDEPWKASDKALVIDAYEFNPIDWQELTSDERIAGFINKASDGLPPEWNCSKLKDDDYKLCQNRWWKYSVTKELYQTRRQMAKMKGLLWGAYHLGRPGNPRAQADHFVDFAEPAEDDLLAIDIEDNSDEWMSLSDAEIFADQIKIRTGRYPVLYTNGSTAQYISDNRADYPLLSRLPLWYARYRGDITGKFPEETWPSYALWQFSSMHNCNKSSCPYRVKGAQMDIDVNVSTLDTAGLKKAWPFDELIETPGTGEADALIASVSQETRKAVAAANEIGKQATPSDPGDTLLAAYGPAEHRATIDPLQMLTNLAKGHAAGGKDGDGSLAGMPNGAASATASVQASTPAQEAAAAIAPHLKSFRETISRAARSLDRMLASPAEAAVRHQADTPAETLRKDERAGLESSRVLEVIATAEAERRANALPMPARVLSQLGADRSDRGSRVRRVSHDHLAALGIADRRIFGAFEATR
ncbi:glycoside hydrolase family 25 protein [Aurantimonas sp. 22II-16-19i]|uniref:glycoside hydrolase family 25 protein n=1 Tax=Aurantimonas sp. 22II-16-19i TaxID=1317114 RepID=UPI0009FADC23|nr:glycoside hydrolase family 25 protein [Aurantimonas sp. 22II-16-19i]